MNLAEKPQKDIYSFIGVLTIKGDKEEKESLGVDNTLWSNTVVASGTIVGLVIYTGSETRSVMNTSISFTYFLYPLFYLKKAILFILFSLF
jgi:phospholipid-translocating ATPase